MGAFKVIPNGPPIIGVGQRWLGIAIADGETTPDAFDVVMCNSFTDGALGTLLGNIRVIVREELDARGIGRRPAKKRRS